MLIDSDSHSFINSVVVSVEEMLSHIAISSLIMQTLNDFVLSRKPTMVLKYQR